MIYEPPRKEQLTQGTIFSCAYAENYQDACSYGLIITARCDIAQAKTPIFSYVPVVAITDWILRDGYYIIMSDSIDDCENSLNSIIDAQSISKTLISTAGYEKIHEAHFLPRAQERGFESVYKKYKRALDEWLKSTNNIKTPPKIKDREPILREHPKRIEKIVKNLAGNKIMGHYLLKDMEDLSGVRRDHVVLLREIHHISRDVSNKIIHGISKNDHINQPDSLCPRFFGNDDLAAPVTKLKSPWIEHLMQSLTLLFSRIGVDDIDHASVKKHLAHLLEA